MLYAEWIDYLGWYRVFDSKHPENTIVYYDEIGEREQALARENGYDGIIERR